MIELRFFIWFIPHHTHYNLRTTIPIFHISYNYWKHFKNLPAYAMSILTLLGWYHIYIVRSYSHHIRSVSFLTLTNVSFITHYIYNPYVDVGRHLVVWSSFCSRFLGRAQGNTVSWVLACFQECVPLYTLFKYFENTSKYFCPM